MVINFLNNGYLCLLLVIFEADTLFGHADIVAVINLIFIVTFDVVSVFVKWLKERFYLNKTSINFNVIGLLENVGWHYDNWSMYGQVNLDTLMFVFTLLDQICIDRSVFPELFQTLRLNLLEIFEV